ncbi:hypothetical protein D9758_018853 [Tetrapyrgos nigripes]|uniref:Uncharacterized protein n=1 Tax=Tetrapyrgos nigripes TaxID=182062 RepID=A0A8H5B927_9AGAR|nr:hypothetical protein D9758_018853 [Tetrapyrgos nigripes]
MSYARERQTHYEDACGQPQYQDIRKSKTEGYFGQGFISFDEGLFDSGDLLAENSDREFKGLRLRLQHEYLNCPTRAWHSAKVVQTRETVSFFFWFHVGVVPMGPHSLSSLSPSPPHLHLQKRAWQYSLFDLCFLRHPPQFSYTSGSSLPRELYLLRVLLVFHDTDKVTTLFVHVYLPFVFTVIRNFYPNTEERFLAFKKLPHLNLLHASVVVSTSPGNSSTGNSPSSTVEKIESGQRTTSFSFLLNNQRGIIGRSLSAISPQSRITAFMGGQLVYMVLTELPAVFLCVQAAYEFENIEET